MVKRRKSQNTVRPTLLNVRLSKMERMQFKECSAALGLSLSAWARMVLRREVAIQGLGRAEHERLVASRE